MLRQARHTIPENSTASNHVDRPLLIAILIVFGIGMIVLYSATGADSDQMLKHGIRAGLAFALMFIVSRISSPTLARWSLNLYLFALLLLVAVLSIGIIGKGAQRWIDLGLFRFQPSEIMKIAIPMATAWVLSRSILPPKIGVLLLTVVIVLVPSILIMRQPDLGTALLVALSGVAVIFLAGPSWKLVVSVVCVMIAAAPVLWSLVLEDYQRRRILTLFDPWSDPLGAGYHSIQSIIAIGSGGIDGKGWLSGTQSQLEFIPERSTDFIFSVLAEEFGILGVLLLLSLYLFLVIRGLVIAYQAEDNYSRLLAGGLSVTFFFYVFVNVGMVSGILPVVGVPLPFISYGGTSMVTLMVGFGILMSISRGKKA